MPDITAAYVFDSDDILIIDNFKSRSDASYTDWSLDELEGLRSKIRNFYREKQSLECAYCKQPVSARSASNCHIEHIAPKSKYFQFLFTSKNLCVICADCNEIKRNAETLQNFEDPLKTSPKRKYPEKSEAFKIFHPHFDNYSDHILRFNRFYVDRSKKGSFTIYACGLNRFIHSLGWEKEFASDEKLALAMRKWLDNSDSQIKGIALTELKSLLLQ